MTTYYYFITELLFGLRPGASLGEFVTRLAYIQSHLGYGDYNAWIHSYEYDSIIWKFVACDIMR